MAMAGIGKLTARENKDIRPKEEWNPGSLTSPCGGDTPSDWSGLLVSSTVEEKCPDTGFVYWFTYFKWQLDLQDAQQN